MRDIDDLGFWIFMSVLVVCSFIAPNLSSDCEHKEHPHLIKGDE